MNAVKQEKPIKTKFNVVDYLGEVKNFLFGNTYTAHNQIIYWGDNNNLPDQLFELYLKNVYVGRIINSTVDYVFGAGLELSSDMTDYIQNNMALDIKREVNFKNEYDRERKINAVNIKMDALEDIVKQQIRDLLIFGTYASDLYFGQLTGTISEEYYIDVSKLRFIEGREAVRYKDRGYSLFSGSGNTYDIPIFNPCHTYDSRAIFMHYNDKERTVYPLPYYYSTIDNIDIDSEITTYNRNTLRNGFSPFTILEVPYDATDEELEKLYENIQKTSTGVKGEKILITRASSADAKVSISAAPQENIDTRFINLEQSTEKRVFTGFNAPKQLFGNQYDSTGFSEQEYFQVYKLYVNNICMPIRNKIIKDYQWKYGIKNPFKIIPLPLEKEAFSSTAKEMEGSL